MRHIRARRRYRVLLILLFIICVTMFVEERIEDLIPRLKGLAEARVEEALGGKLNFTVGSIDGGVIHPIVINDIRIEQKDASQFIESLVIDSVRTNYYIADLIKAMSGSELSPLLNRNSSAYVNFSARNGDVKGFIGLFGDLSDAAIDGYLVFFRKDRINFSGHIRDGKFEGVINSERPEMGSVRVSGCVPFDNAFTINLKFDHIKVAGFDIACDAILKNELVKGDAPSGHDRVEGYFETHNTILNFKPFVDLRASYSIARDSIEIRELGLGDMLKAYGKVSLKSPGGIDLTVTLNNVNLSWVMQMMGKREASSVLTGILSGKFEFKGPSGKVRMSSVFDIKAGAMGELDFDYLTATVKGELPFLKIEDSRITRPSGYFSIAGELDMRRAGKDNIFDDLKLVTDDTAITWDEWNSKRGKDVEELNMRKSLAGGFGFGYKKYMKEEKLDESFRDSDEAHLDYMLQDKDSIKLMVSQDNDFFGFEHKDKF